MAAIFVELAGFVNPSRVSVAAQARRRLPRAGYASPPSLHAATTRSSRNTRDARSIARLAKEQHGAQFCTPLCFLNAVRMRCSSAL
jgi:hypothetical protein